LKLKILITRINVPSSLDLFSLQTPNVEY